ncbi:MAG: Calx-beta domain-containing protein, partial [Planctomycetota bacterium]
ISATVTVTPVDDGEIELDETVVLTLVDGERYNIGGSNSGTVMITGDNDVPSVSIVAGDANAAEQGQDTGTFTVTRSGQGLLTLGDLVVQYGVGGTASAGDLTEALGGWVTIPDGQASASIDVVPTDDGDYERGETVVLTLTADSGYTIGPSAAAAVTIADDDPPDGPAQVDFELPGSEDDFAVLAGAPGVARVAGRGGYVLDLWKGNSVGSAKYSPQGDYLLTEGTVGAEAYLRYYNAIGSPHSLVVKGWDDAGHPGGYVVTLQPVAGSVKLWIGASKGPGAGTWPWEFYNTSSGHSDPMTGAVVTAYEGEIDDTVNEAGWWRMEATVTVVGGTAVQIDVTLTDPDEGVYNYSWTDSGPMAETGPGTVGVSTLCLWSIHGQFDNFTVVPTGAEPVTVDIEASDADLAEEGPDGGAFTITRGDATGILTVHYVVSGTAGAGDFTEWGALPGFVQLDDGQASAAIDITPVDDGCDEGDETVRITVISGFDYFVGDDGTARVSIADNDQHPVETIVLDFETPGEEEQLPLRTPGTSARAGGHYGNVLDLFRSNSSGLAIYDPDGYGYTMTEGKVLTDVHLQYVNDFADHTLGSAVSLVLKEWTDARDQHGGYVVTLMPVDGEVQLWIGASNQPGAGTARWDFHRTGATGHTKYLCETVAAYDEELSGGIHSLGWWTVDADLTVIPGSLKDEVRI